MASHILSKGVYFSVFGVLLVLTALTVWVAGFDLGPYNNLAALAIAVTKALLVVLYFMHIRYSPTLLRLVVTGGFLWLLILLGLTLADYLSRSWEQ